jgi:hypothetical protein
MTTDITSKASEWVECILIMENQKIKEMTGKENLIEVPFTFEMNSVVSYRQSINDEGYLEDYTVVYTEFGNAYCIDITYGEFNYMHKKFRDDNKTV